VLVPADALVKVRQQAQGVALTVPDTGRALGALRRHGGTAFRT